jgi:hypothetical protein
LLLTQPATGLLFLPEESVVETVRQEKKYPEPEENGNKGPNNPAPE